ncbi:hypothetical protein ACTI_69070 [Actinoplanes sp. OR16]|nr:hypothetical protein ACTI_69070 [Actinoplanes sp. OR16]
MCEHELGEIGVAAGQSAKDVAGDRQRQAGASVGLWHGDRQKAAAGKLAQEVGRVAACEVTLGSVLGRAGGDGVGEGCRTGLIEGTSRFRGHVVVRGRQLRGHRTLLGMGLLSLANLVV